MKLHEILKELKVGQKARSDSYSATIFKDELGHIRWTDDKTIVSLYSQYLQVEWEIIYEKRYILISEIVKYIKGENDVFVENNEGYTYQVYLSTTFTPEELTDFKFFIYV